ncbi:MAG: rhodanese-like domain-containing protein [Planctomycetes bacterium]|nr:rhodanese-like domain-containing protein [Planctomycetota bacterium]
MTQTQITPDMTMEAILAAIPSAQRALFQRYHVGGCSSCGFQPTDTLAKVCKDRNLLDVNEVIQTLERAHEVDQRMQVAPAEVRGWLDAGEDFSFIDVRPPAEVAQAAIPGAEALDFAAQDRYMALPKDRKLVFTCRDGARALDVASYFVGHGFTRVFAVRGGLDAWRAEVDPSLPTYAVPS